MTRFAKLLLLVLSTCASTPLYAQQQQDSLPGMAFPTPPIYYEWWHEVEACVGQTRDLHQMNFRVMPTPHWQLRYVSNGQVDSVFYVRGMYNDSTATIFLGLGWEAIGPVVRHEMAHAITREVGNAHPADVFKKCAVLFDVPASVTSDSGSFDGRR